MTGSTSTPAAELEKAQQEIVQMRRELLRWKLLARQHEARVRDMESSVSWRWSVILRILPQLRNHWKVLALFGVLGLLCLPFLPLILVLSLFPRGRSLLWSIVWRIRPIHDRLAFLKQKIQTGKRPSRGKASAIAPLIFRRPLQSAALPLQHSRSEIQLQLMQQLCPQQRVLLERYQLSRDALVGDTELPELHSLHSTEVGLLRTIMTQQSNIHADQGDVR